MFIYIYICLYIHAYQSNKQSNQCKQNNTNIQTMNMHVLSSDMLCDGCACMCYLLNLSQPEPVPNWLHDGVEGRTAIQTQWGVL